MRNHTWLKFSNLHCSVFTHSRSKMHRAYPFMCSHLTTLASFQNWYMFEEILLRNSVGETYLMKRQDIRNERGNSIALDIGILMVVYSNTGLYPKEFRPVSTSRNFVHSTSLTFRGAEEGDGLQVKTLRNVCVTVQTWNEMPSKSRTLSQARASHAHISLLHSWFMNIPEGSYFSRSCVLTSFEQRLLLETGAFQVSFFWHCSAPTGMNLRLNLCDQLNILFANSFWGRLLVVDCYWLIFSSAWNMKVAAK